MAWYNESKRHSLASRGIKSAQKMPRTMLYSKGNVPDFVKEKILSEQQVNLLKRRLNDGKITPNEIIGDGKAWRLTPEQTEKGLKYLMSLWKTPTGKEKEMSPFGFRETNVLENFSRFEVIDFYNNNTYQQQQMGINNYQPLYRVVAKDGSSFEYYMDFRSDFKIAIVG